MKYSRQRELIKDIVINNKIHPTADKVYSILHEENPTISLATVYRNLKLLSDEGVITKITIPTGSDCFDGEIEEHYHMICTNCGGVYDSPLEVLTGLDEHVQKLTGFDVMSHQLILYGICENCQCKA